jgi:hypothetical protein
MPLMSAFFFDFLGEQGKVYNGLDCLLSGDYHI